MKKQQKFSIRKRRKKRGWVGFPTKSDSDIIYWSCSWVAAVRITMPRCIDKKRNDFNEPEKANEWVCSPPNSFGRETVLLTILLADLQCLNLQKCFQFVLFKDIWVGYIFEVLRSVSQSTCEVKDCMRSRKSRTTIAIEIVSLYQCRLSVKLKIVRESYTKKWAARRKVMTLPYQ